MTTSQPESQSAEPSQAGSIEPTHFDDLLAGIGDDGGAGPIVNSGDMPDNVPQLTEAEFIEFYAEVFGMAADGTGFKSLEITPEDKKALAAMHRRAMASKYFRWMLKPGGPVMMDWILIGRFIGAKAQGVAAEIQAKQGQGEAPEAGKADIPDYDFSETVQ